MSHVYADNYYDYIDRGSMRSADVMIPLLRRHLPIASVLDVGCGRGAWLARWQAAGIDDFVGIDGDYVQIDKLPFASDHFIAADLTRTVDLGRRFDLVQCLEVAEHLPAAAADTLVETLVLHGDTVLFSAAVPGQGGEYHVNEQPIDYWVAKFARHDFEAWDVLRPNLRSNGDVQPWYRFNAVLFIRKGSPVPAGERYPASGYSVPRSWRLRNGVIGLLPSSVVGRLARLKHEIFRTLRR